MHTLKYSYLHEKFSYIHDIYMLTEQMEWVYDLKGMTLMVWNELSLNMLVMTNSGQKVNFDTDK